MVGGRSKVKCEKCKKIIKGHIFNRFNKTLCANCYSVEFQKKLYSGEYMTMKILDKKDKE